MNGERAIKDLNQLYEEYEQKEQEKKVIRQFAKRISEQEGYNLSSLEIDILEGMIHRTIEQGIRRFLRA